MINATESSSERDVLRITLKIDPKVEGKTDIVCDTVKKCLDCSRIITGKYVNFHKCSYSGECNNCNKYVDKNHKCFMKKIKAKGGHCTVDSKKPCKNNDSIKMKDWCHSCKTYTEKYIFYDFEATQNTGTHTVNLSTVHKTSKAKNTCITVSRNSVKAS